MAFYIETPHLSLFDFGWYRSPPHVSMAWAICEHHLREFFNLSDGTKHICFRAYKDPGEGRVKLDLNVDFDPESMDNCILDDTYMCLPTQTLNEIKRLAMGLTLWYVEVICDWVHRKSRPIS